MKKVVVTGASGFIGGWLVKKLCEKGLEVYAIVREKNSNISRISNYANCNIVYCDMKEITSLTKKIDCNIDVFIHLAWEGSGGAKRSNYELQLLNTKYSCDSAIVAKKLGCKKFLCSGTISEKFVEDIFSANVKSENMIYAIQKHTTRCLLDVLCKNLDLDYVWMRFSNIYGPYNTSGNIVSYMLNELKRGGRPSFSKGEQPYDLMYVEDLTEAIYLLATKKTSKKCYFLGSGNPRFLKDYLIEIKNAYGDGVEIGLGERPDDGLKFSIKWFDTQDLKKDVGFVSQFDFYEAISRTINWIKEK